jgi:hypothetical protein
MGRSRRREKRGIREQRVFGSVDTKRREAVQRLERVQVGKEATRELFSTTR